MKLFGGKHADGYKKRESAGDTPAPNDWEIEVSHNEEPPPNDALDDEPYDPAPQYQEAAQFGGQFRQRGMSSYTPESAQRTSVYDSQYDDPDAYVEETKPKRVHRFRVPLIILCCVLLVVGGGVVAYMIWEKPPDISSMGLDTIPTVKPSQANGTLDDPEQRDNSVGIEISETPRPTESATPVSDRKEDCYTFVVLVMDQGSGNTDGIVIGRMDTKAGTLDMVNLPRDTLVNVTWSVKKANTLYSFENSDFDRFNLQLKKLLGFTVDCYAVMELTAVEKLVDAIGGIDYDIPSRMYYEDDDQNLLINIPAGQQHLNGEQAVKAMRYRSYADADIGRISFTQGLLKALASQMLTLGNIPNLDKITDIFQNYVTTNLSSGNIAFFAREFLMMDRDNIQFQTAPGKGVSIRRGSYWELDWEAWVETINDALSPFRSEVTLEHLDILRYLGSEGAVSNTGEQIPLSSFYQY